MLASATAALPLVVVTFSEADKSMLVLRVVGSKASCVYLAVAWWLEHCICLPDGQLLLLLDMHTAARVT